jgi:hypothetical protein
MKELDLLKKDWDSKKNFPAVSEEKIYAMLHRNSSSTVKWIFIISLFELGLGILLNFFVNADKIFKKANVTYLIDVLKYLTFFNYFVVAIFIFFFYKNYINISTISSTKKLMTDILRTRKTVQYYVWYNLGMIVASTIFGFLIVVKNDPKIGAISSNNSVFIITLLICILLAVVFVVVFWLFYKLLYGILLKKLYRNYKELEKIDL